ncbi:Cytochrome P450 [Exophiala dermatitidis]
MIWITLAAAILCILVLLYTARKPKIHRNGQRLRRPPDTLPILGNAIHFLKPRHVLFDWFVKCQQLFGKETLEISVPSLPPGVVINSPDNLEYVLKNEASITKGDFFRERSWDLFGYGIINATGDLWRTQRKAGLKFFSGTNLDILIEEVLPEIYEDNTRKQLVQAAKDGSVIDLQKIFLDLTTTVVGHMAYDMEISASSPFSKAFDHASDRIGLRFQNPLWRLTEFLFTGTELRASLTEVKRFGRQIVANARKRRSRAAFESLVTDDQTLIDDSSMFGSLIDSLIEAFAKPQVVADAALNFLSAGRDTTAQSLTWTFYALMRHPTSLKRLRDEIDSKFQFDINNSKSQDRDPDPHPASGSTNADKVGGDDDDNDKDKDNARDPSTRSTHDQITISSLQPTSLPFTVATFYESLRLYPPVPFELKQTSEPVTLPDGTFLPAGAIVVWCIYAMNRAKEAFGNDAHLFRPERWLDHEGRLVPKSAFEFPVFNGGPRACLGKKMAEVMAAWVMVKMCSEWEFEEVVDDSEDSKERAAASAYASVNVSATAAPETTAMHHEKKKTFLNKERVSANSLTLPMEGGLPCQVKARGTRKGTERNHK